MYWSSEKVLEKQKKKKTLPSTLSVLFPYWSMGHVTSINSAGVSISHITIPFVTIFNIQRFSLLAAVHTFPLLYRILQCGHMTILKKEDWNY
jgi:hypothetical protein